MKKEVGHTSNTQGFSDAIIPGGAEQKQTIPSRPIPGTERIGVHYSSDTSHDKSFHDMHQYAAFQGKPAVFVPFMTYWPTYDSMRKQQKLWYFYWRLQVRLGNYLDTDLSYIFLYIYELLSGVGWQTPQEGYDLLIRTWSSYKERFPQLNNYLSDWIFDFSQMHNLSYSSFLDGNLAPMVPSTMTDMLVAQHEEDVPLKLPFSLIDALCDYSFANSKFYKEGNQDLIQEAIPRIVALADAALRKKTQKGILTVYGPNRPRKQEYHAFRSAVCPQANKKMTLWVKAYSTNQRLRGYINKLVRYGENTLRELRGYRGRLGGMTLDEETAKLVQSFLKKEYGQPSPKANEPVTNDEVILDFENIDVLREQSDAVRAALHVEESALHVKEAGAPPAKAFLTDSQEITGVNVALSSDSRQLTQAGDNSKLFDLSVLTPELKDFVECLVPEQQKTLHALLTCQHPHGKLEQIAEEAMTMPQILLDDINGVAMQTLGDILVDFIEQEPHLLDEYVTTLKKSIAWERSQSATINN